ncbi:hypothetical protein K439DRAFT_362643 [Ramaria rubella]|nr:hypothetical protein K439DRAFT_362643 [Ramaria rubella]
MASEQPQNNADVSVVDVPIAQESDQGPAAVLPVEAPAAGRKRPRIDLTTESRERKRGKSMFGILLGTLNKAKKEDHDRSASDAAKKRADIDKRLQAQLAEENDNVRRAEELKRDRQAASRKEEELKLRETIYYCRRTRLPALAHFLLTSDTIPPNDSEGTSTPLPISVNPLAAPPRSHPPPLFYLPAILTASQAAFIENRKVEVKEAVEKEWQDWLMQRKDGYEEVDKLRARVEEEEKRRDDGKSKEDSKGSKDSVERPDTEQDVKMDEVRDPPANTSNGDDEPEKTGTSAPPEKEKEPVKEGDVVMAADGDDAVEY